MLFKHLQRVLPTMLVGRNVVLIEILQCEGGGGIVESYLWGQGNNDLLVCFLDLTVCLPKAATGTLDQVM